MDTEDKALSAENPGQRPWAAISLPRHSLQQPTRKEESPVGPMLAVGKGIYPADKHPDEGLRKFLQTTSEDRFITSQLQICLLDQVVPFWNSLAKTTLSSSFICLGAADML